MKLFLLLYLLIGGFYSGAFYGFTGTRISSYEQKVLMVCVWPLEISFVAGQLFSGLFR